MKKVICLLIVLFLTLPAYADIEEAKKKSEEKIKIIGKNNVEVQKILYDKEKKEVIIETESFGLGNVSAQIDLLDNQILNWQNPEWINSQIQKLQEQKARWEAIKVKLLESLQ